LPVPDHGLLRIVSFVMDDLRAMPPQPVVDPLGLDLAEMRALGHLVVDRVVDHWAGLSAKPTIATTPIDELAPLGGPIPYDPMPARESIDLLTELALTSMQHGGHPRNFARVPGPASFTGVLGDWLGVGFNAMSASWAGGAGLSFVELTVLDWLRELMGLPPGTEGVLVSGGSIGNVTALVAARQAGFDGNVYLSDQTHSSIARGLRVLGWTGDQIQTVATGAGYRWSAAAVADRLRRDASPAIVVATAGTTNTGAVDPLDELADLCEQHGAWLHVDGAYGAPAALTAGGRVALRGIERADSLTIDPHKWLFQPYDLGCVLVRRPGVLEACYSMDAEYLRDVRTVHAHEVNFRSRGLELTRRTRALKLWLTIKTHGINAISAAIAHSIELAESSESLLARDPYWEVTTPAQLGVITFAARGLPGDEHVRRAKAITQDGYAAVSCTELSGRTVYRLCMINPRTTMDDITSTLQRLRVPAD
jgi:glutamate/tyrosine decarboxylase-like PLP-dependent enzyme